MFSYSDPSGILDELNAIQEYQRIIDWFYMKASRAPGSAFTSLSALSHIPGDITQVADVSWLAFPKLAINRTAFEIDAQRFRYQDEYVEWRSIQKDGQLHSVEFCTQFPEFYQSLACRGFEALVAGIRQVIPSANPTFFELFGSEEASFSSDELELMFRENILRNPWANGEKGIICLSHRNNTMSALFELAIPCSRISSGNLMDICSNLDGACESGRNSDPHICSSLQKIARSNHALSFQDPVGIEIERLEGIWTSDDVEIDILNTPEIWRVSKNRRHATLICSGLKMDREKIASGAQVAAALFVRVRVLHAAESHLPIWARTGEESSRAIT